MMPRIIHYLRNRPVALRIFFFACLGGIACSDFFVTRPAVHFFGDAIPVFWSVFGLAGCTVLAGACKWIAKKFLARDEDYYDG